MVLLFLLCFEVYYLYVALSGITSLVKYTIPAPTLLAYTAMFSLTALMAAIGILVGGVFAPFKMAQTGHRAARPGLQ